MLDKIKTIFLAFSYLIYFRLLDMYYTRTPLNILKNLLISSISILLGLTVFFLGLFAISVIGGYVLHQFVHLYNYLF